MQIRIRGFRLKRDEAGGEHQLVIVEGQVSPDGPRVDAAVLDGPTADLLTQISTSAGVETFHRRLAENSLLWACKPCAEFAAPEGPLRVQVRDASSICSLGEQLRTLMFAAERGEPILVGFPPWQGEGGY